MIAMHSPKFPRLNEYGGRNTNTITVKRHPFKRKYIAKMHGEHLGEFNTIKEAGMSLSIALSLHPAMARENIVVVYSK